MKKDIHPEYQCSVDEALVGGDLAAALAYRDDARARGQRDHLRVYQRVVEYDVGASKHAGRTQCQQIGCARPRPNEIDLAHQSMSPAATVWLVTSSIRMNAPVARMRS